MMKACHITSVHSANDVRIFHNECVSLAKAGYEMLLVAPGAESYERQGVKIIGIGSAPESRLSRVFRVAKQAVMAATSTRASVYHIHDPELLRCIPFLRRYGKVVYDVHEDVPRDILDKDWIPSPLRRPTSHVAELVENHYARQADCIVAATPRIARRFLKLNERTTTISNYPSLSGARPVPPWDHKERAVCYVGSITRSRGILEMIDAVDAAGVTLHLAGAWHDEGLRNEATRLPGWRRVVYHGYVDRQQVADILGRSRAGLVVLHPTPAYLESQPIKLFEYMEAGIPFIASAFPTWMELTGEGSGIFVQPGDRAALRDAISLAVTDDARASAMGATGKLLVSERFSWDREAERLAQVYSLLS